MKKKLGMLKDIVFVSIILFGTFFIGYSLGHYSNNKETVETEDLSNDINLELPFESEKSIVTVEEVESRLFEIGELSTFTGEYTCNLGKEELRYVLDKIPIIGSKNTIEINCDGIVKLGYNMQEIDVNVDDEKIYISIPEVKLNDNYVIWDSIVCNESNSIFNPIEFSQYKELIGEIEKKGLENVISKGIYQNAESNLKVLIEAFLAEFDGYTIVYM